MAKKKIKLRAAGTSEDIIPAGFGFVDDTRSVNTPPEEYKVGVHYEFKQCGTIGIYSPSNFCHLRTEKRWPNASGGVVIQYATIDTGKTFMRTSQNGFSEWSHWTELKFTDTTYAPATQAVAGLMSAADKLKLDTLSTPYVVGRIDTIDPATVTMDKLLEIFGPPADLKAAIFAGRQIVSHSYSGTAWCVVSPCVNAVCLAGAFVLSFEVHAPKINVGPELKTWQITSSGATYGKIVEINNINTAIEE